MKKIFWFFRAVFYNFFTKFPIPGYIGKICYVSSLKKITFGKKVRIYPGMRAEISGKNGKINIGNNVSIGQNFHVVSNEKDLNIGNNVVISGNVFISNCDHSYDNIEESLFNQPLKNKETKIGDNCFIGYGAVILAGTILSNNCIVGANSVVKGIFPSNTVIAGAPARIIKKYNLKKNKWERVI